VSGTVDPNTWKEQESKRGSEVYNQEEAANSRMAKQQRVREIQEYICIWGIEEEPEYRVRLNAQKPNKRRNKWEVTAGASKTGGK